MVLSKQTPNTTGEQGNGVKFKYDITLGGIQVCRVNLQLLNCLQSHNK